MLELPEVRHRSCRVEVLPERRDPLALARLWADRAHFVLLKTSDARTREGQWIFFGADPFLVFRSKRAACWAGRPGQERRLPRSPLVELAAILEHYRLPAEDDCGVLPELPFRGGALGYLGYELLYLLEDIPDLGRDDLAVPDCYLLFFDTVVACHARTGQVAVIANGFGPSPGVARRHADQRLRDAAREVRASPEVGTVASSAPRGPRRRLSEHDLVSRGIHPVLPRAGYLDLIETAKAHIRAGDIFEICTCNRFDTTFSGSGFELFCALQRVNPAPYSAYLRLPEVEVLSSSPERFLSLDRDRWVETRPMKGTRPRGRTPDEDRELSRQLAQSEKDRAENIMIVDLARNDLGRVCEFGSVTVPDLQVVETFAFTHQMVSTVRGRLLGAHTTIDLIAATFPGGSMTGAPKVEAMKIIDRLEPVKRGIFSGSIGYLDFEGMVGLNIVIRTLIKKGTALNFHVGGAIVSDSDAADEHQEILDKAAGLVAALEEYEAAGRPGSSP
ncbi:MAG: aminodeoxychorismate synthase component I [Deltaproteobacteria bacterium]|nr:MAG: aminodeoxychorismate synthase component I [Deltaproteobacteria bacterium]